MEFDGNFLKSIVAFGNIAIFTILILLVHEHGTYTNHVMSSTISFFDIINCYTVLSLLCSTSSVFVATMNGIVSLISFSANWPFIFGKGSDFVGLFCNLLFDESICQLAEFLGK